jgi:hypothetical protein
VTFLFVILLFHYYKGFCVRVCVCVLLLGVGAAVTHIAIRIYPKTKQLRKRNDKRRNTPHNTLSQKFGAAAAA